MIPTVTIQSGDSIGSSPVSSTQVTTTDTLLADMNGVYVISIDGFYIRVGNGVPSGNTTSTVSNTGSSIPSGTVQSGNEIGTSPFTPGA